MIARKLISALGGLLLVISVMAQEKTFSVAGIVLSKSTGDPVEFATVVLEASGQWAVADAKGRFSIAGVQGGKTTVTVSCLGYVDDSREITVSRDILNYKVSLADDNLTLANAVVTAQENSSSATTSRTVDRTALDHVQVMNVSDISALLPGGSTTNAALTSSQRFSIRESSGEDGNASFGTAVEVDGVRLSSNASFSGTSGVTTNNIASSNVESVEVITGVPSVEYGDMSSGIVKINTRKGKTPYMVTMSTSPNTKQVSLSKGFGLGDSRRGRSRGVLNSSVEYARSISNQMSPYTSYDRKQLSLTYSNLLGSGIFAASPLRLSAGVTGNIGGLDDSADPDKLRDTYTITRDNALRANLTANLLLSKTWITNVELNASVSYGDKRSKSNSFYDSAVSTSVLHQTSEGYYMADQIPAGYWYNLMVTDDKPFAAKVTLKANWARKFGSVSNKVKVGADWNADKNFGVGQYSDDFATAPTYREYRYCDVPVMSNIAAYLEDNLMVPVGRDGRVNVIAGLRNDNTVIPGSAYGITSSLSPRFNARYTVFTPKTRSSKTLRELSFRASWGVAVKQPSYAILYPTPSYIDINVFTSTASSSNETSRAYYVLPRTIEYNSSLVWQQGNQSEIGVDFNLAGNKVSLAAFYNRTLNAYRLVSGYDNISYAYTSTGSVQGLTIPAENRRYLLDGSTGAVTVVDKTGSEPSIEIPYTTRHQFQTRTSEDNDDNPVTRYGLEWVVDFRRISPINTTVRVDGTFYTYRSLYTDIVPYCPYTTSSYDGTPYKYVGYYYGGNGLSNGTLTRTLKTNVTFTTNIPKVRMVISMKIESCLLKQSRFLSERKGGSARSQVITDPSDILSTALGSIYDGENYTVLYPYWYSSYDDPEPKDYISGLKWAKYNDPELYADLSKLAVTSNYTFYYKTDRITPYFSANFSVTKEIGDLASISMYVNNFLNNMSQLYSSRTGTYVSASNYVPSFYYGLTVRLKF